MPIIQAATFPFPLRMAYYLGFLAKKYFTVNMK